MKRITLTLIIAFAVATGAFAQDHIDINYAIGFGMGDLGDYISQPSFRGISFDYRHAINPNMSVGFNLAWSTFYSEESRKTYTVDNQSLTGKQYRYSNNMPMLATFTYDLSPEEFVAPYATLGIGTMYIRRNTDMNLYTWEQEAWPFVLQPEVGVRFRTSDKVRPTVSLKYTNGFKAGDFDATQSYLALNLGLAFF